MEERWGDQLPAQTLKAACQIEAIFSPSLQRPCHQLSNGGVLRAHISKNRHEMAFLCRGPGENGRGSTVQLQEREAATVGVTQ